MVTDDKIRDNEKLQYDVYRKAAKILHVKKYDVLIKEK